VALKKWAVDADSRQADSVGREGMEGVRKGHVRAHSKQQHLIRAAVSLSATRTHQHSVILY